MEYKNKNEDMIELILKAKNGDTDAFGFIYNKYFKLIYRYIYYRIKNKEEAKDIVQETFLKAFKSVHNFKDTGKNPLAYFFVIAKNLLTDYYRKKENNIKKNSIEDYVNILKDEKENIQEKYIKKEIKEDIEKKLSNLNDQQKEIIILKFINELSNKEISIILNKKEDAIRQLQCRALKNLNKII